MVELSRMVRFCVSPGDPERAGEGGRNTFAGWPSMVGIGTWYEMEVTCRGPADPITGYLVNISEIDKAVRTHAVPVVANALRESPGTSPARLLPALLGSIQGPLAGLVRGLTWRLTPYYSVGMRTSAPEQAVVSVTFEFAAAHRLNCSRLSPEENRRLFGKCNNPGAHGHNYRLEVAVAVPIADSRKSESGFDNLTLERIVDERLIKRFDHMNLDADVPEFADCNSSVENIARVCYDLLAPAIERCGVRLARVRVWETEKTSCTYPAA